ncbi:MAG: cysteate synthase [Candidatus Heimdallarchaeota archaeon]
MYKLRCLSCNSVIPDNYSIVCTCGKGGFYRSIYPKKQFVPTNEPNIWRFHDWLPINTPPSGKSTNKKSKTTAGKTTVYKSNKLAKELGLQNLYIAFNGYWPEKKANLLTGTFKGLEAPPSILRAKENGVKSILLATAGNTGRAFAEETINQDFEIIIVAAKSASSRLWTTEEVKEHNIKYIVLANGNDYTNAIELGKRICVEVGVETEGGARNVARRDGMGTCFLEGVAEIGKMPKHYFQAIGSGTGGIAAWEASLRLIEDGNYGNKLSHLHLSQNSRFAPIAEAWNAKRKQITNQDLSLPPQEMSTLFAEVLANRTPPYSVEGGVYQALSETQGKMYSVTEEEAKSAMKLMYQTEEIDIVPPAAIAVASLIQAVNEEKVSPRESILLNITGGGIARLKEDYNLIPLEAAIEVKNPQIDLTEIAEICLGKNGTD